MNSLPPKLLKYCRICENLQYFKYNKYLGHSCCNSCGNHSGYRIETINRLKTLEQFKIIYDSIKNDKRVIKIVGGINENNL